MTAPRATTLTRWLPALAAVVALLPLLWFAKDLRDLFWFGDEWDQLDQISKMGFWRWTLWCFGENFAPVLKLSWGGLAAASGGSYFFMVAAVWVVHAVCVLLLGRWLLRAGFSAFAAAVVLAGFALSYSNLETLGWTIQLITIQGVLFFVAAANWHEARNPGNLWSASSVLLFALLVTLSTFSFVRGALTGGSLAVATVVPLLVSRGSRPSWRSRIPVLAACLIPAAISVAVIMIFAPGNHHHVAGSGLKAPALFAAAYFLLNPLFKLATDGDLWTTGQFVACAAVKIAVLVFGWLKATPSQRRLLLTVLVFDLGNAALMGIGRYNEPVVTATSSRYQYFGLLCTLPFLAIALEALLHPLAFAPRWRAAAASIVLLLLTYAVTWGWRRDVPSWVDNRGRETRNLVFRDPHPPAEGAIPGIPFLTTARAKEIAAQYHLH